MTDAVLLPLDDALELVLANVRPLGMEPVPLGEAAGRYLAEAVAASLDLPPFTNSAMDGFALRSADTPGALELIGESAAGSPFLGAVGPGQAVVISTGAVLPDGADAVVPVEWVDRDSRSRPTAAGSVVEVPRAVRHDYSVRHAGSDVRAGEQVLPAGIRIGPGQIGAAASLGLGSLSCGRLPRVAVLTTGSELRPPGAALAPGEIYDSNGPLLRAALASAGADVTLIPAAADTREAHRAAIERALEFDVVLSTGGVSVGGHDLVREVERELGVRELFWRIAMKPGKPLSFGVRDRTLVFGIPGNPVSVMVCFELFVRPAIAAMQGAAAPRPPFTRARLVAAVRQNPERDELIRVQRHADGGVEPLRGQQSHQLALSSRSDGLARIPIGDGTLAAGTEVSYLPLGAS
ncbi:MAG TPA: gephyrin-like molybdotransferase Glp [Solirubrobacteraceae bacterium]|jgi:molybdopterin molybdotransferase|nr:gephyrin-like molybdotransferase Glp [Solirubrobacteraceae bacterium]